MDRGAFRTELQRLVARAREDGVEVGGGYNVRSPDPDMQDYTVEITEQEKRITDGGIDSASTGWTSSTAVAAPAGGGATRGSQRRAVDRFLLAPIV
ncbi:hypothetical protein BRC86_04965 [Halobacteriales archaeon QS_3_64_16]|nr:MAG: hypothetical protein BRC86_04965 [Halobacteriales archaeon QS_3_64_16]